MDHDIFCQCGVCKANREALRDDPMADSCAALEGPGPYLPAAVATILGIPYQQLLKALCEYRLLDKRAGIYYANETAMDAGMVITRWSKDAYGFLRKQILITDWGLDLLRDLLV